MKRFKKGPELKLSELKIPPVLRDLYGDLRDRRLLPLLALVLVAIVAVPFLLSESPPETSPASTGSADPSEAAQASSLTVVEAHPDLRDYRRRLRGRAPTDPFHQRFSGPMLKGAELSSVTETGGSSPESTSSTSASDGSVADVIEGGSEGGSEPANPGGANPSPAGPQTQAFTFAMKVQISHTEEQEDGSQKMGEPVVREGVRPLTPLPGEKAPVVTYLGANLETGKAIFMISRDVTAAFGDAECISGTDSCELMEVEKGFPETFEYGPNKVRYKFNVIKLDVVRSGKP
ncbi:MAG TPA: hypothetical protein VFU11_04055 [Solirubrobacterales bacterium]|nr:hypothetical protein [Solirubrobacterales bacterium]